MNRAEPRLSIEVREVSKVFVPAPRWLRMMVKSPIKTDIQALRSVSLAVEPGEVCALVGPNGAGKTTLFRILVGVTTPTTGSASVLGHDVVTDSLAIRRQVGWMPTSDQSLFQRHTCSDNLRFHGRLHGLAGSELEMAVGEILEMVGISGAADNAVISLSAGMKARLLLARSLLHKPQILILDEPTASVDPVASLGIINLVMEIVRERGLAAIISSHRLDEIEALHSRVLLLHRGEVVHDGDLDDLRAELNRPQLEFTFSSEESAASAARVLEASAAVDGVEVGGSDVHVVPVPGSSTGAILKQLDGRLDDLVSARETIVPLRDVLADVYGVSDRSKIEEV